MNEGEFRLIRDYDSRLLAKEQVAPDIWHLTFACPEIAENVRPGNFVLLKTASGSAPLLRRPLGILNADLEKGTIETLFRVVGQGTALLAQAAPETSLSVRGPVGGQFGPFRHEKVWAVAGTLGIAPLLFLRRRLNAFDRLFLGVGNALWRSFA
ncbi:MAG: FAD-binding oxidoreductase, partial [Pyramidobacter sp.]|nr:FAD-binding oxidoreductase [Pyramidobacter sp.]